MYAIGEEEEKRYDAVKRAQLKARARVMEEKRKSRNATGEGREYEERRDFRSTEEERFEREDSFKRPPEKQGQDQGEKKQNQERVRDGFARDDSVRDDEREQGYDSKERDGYWCDVYLCASEFVVRGMLGRENGCVDIGFAKGELNAKEDESDGAAAKVRDE